MAIPRPNRLDFHNQIGQIPTTKQSKSYRETVSIPTTKQLKKVANGVVGELLQTVGRQGEGHRWCGDKASMARILIGTFKFKEGLLQLRLGSSIRPYNEGNWPSPNLLFYLFTYVGFVGPPNAEGAV